MIYLPDAFKLDICREGEKAYPNECCGVMLGLLDTEGSYTVSQLLPIVNSREAEEQYHRFVIEPDDYMRAELTARKNGIDILGFYHSHPDHPAIPSDYDREHALPFFSYVIVSVVKRKAAELTSWLLSTDRKEFLSEPIISESAQAVR